MCTSALKWAQATLRNDDTLTKHAHTEEPFSDHSPTQCGSLRHESIAHRFCSAAVSGPDRYTSARIDHRAESFVGDGPGGIRTPRIDHRND